MTTSTEPKASPRIQWVDQIRGCAILYMIVFELSRGAWRSAYPLLAFFLTHGGPKSGHPTLVDIGTSGFVFIMGLMFAWSFQRARARVGPAKASLHILQRYGLIFLLGALASFLGHGALFRELTLDDGSTMRILYWDALPTLGWAGLVGMPFLALPPRARLMAAYVLLLFYQVMLSSTGTGWELLVVKSTHGGVIAATFSFGAQLIAASALGEFLFVGNLPASKVQKLLAIFSAAQLAVGLGVVLFLDLEASRSQVSAAYALISMGVTSLSCLVFFMLEQRRKTSRLLEALGKNPLLLYLLTLILDFVLFEALPFEEATPLVQFLIGLLAMASMAFLALHLHRRGRVVRTEQVALVALLILLILAILVPTDLVEQSDW